MSERNFEAISSAAVIVSNSQFFSTSSILFQTSAAVSFLSLFKSKKSDRLCWTFLSGVKCKRNRVYSLCRGKMLGSRSLTVLVISVSALSCSQYCGSICLEFVIIDRSISLVILIYCTNFRHQRFALELSYFSRLGMDNFWVHVRSHDFSVWSLGSDRLLVD